MSAAAARPMRRFFVTHAPPAPRMIGRAGKAHKTVVQIDTAPPCVRRNNPFSSKTSRSRRTVTTETPSCSLKKFPPKPSGLLQGKAHLLLIMGRASPSGPIPGRGGRSRFITMSFLYTARGQENETLFRTTSCYSAQNESCQSKHTTPNSLDYKSSHLQTNAFQSLRKSSIP